MKKKYLIILYVLILTMISACSDKEPQSTEKPEVTSTIGSETISPTTEPTATPVASPSAEPTDTITHIVEGFDNMTNPVADMKPMDLSPWGIENPLLSIVTDGAESDKAMKVELNQNRWCQAYQINDSTRLTVFKENAKDDMYLRLFVHNPNPISIGVTIQLSNGSDQSFPDSTVAKLTTIDGKTVETTTGNATDDAGLGSSINVPGKFTGWIAWSLGSLKPWSNKTGLKDFNINYIRIDMRPQGPNEGDLYIIDNFCITNSLHGVLKEGVTFPGNNDNYEEKSDEISNLFKQIKNKEPEFEYCPEYDPAGYPDIKTIWFIGEKYGQKQTKVFAYIGFPKNASKDKPVPGVVLQHGGGGYAFPSWIKEWTDRGYAAIAVCNTGYYPARKGITDFYGAGSWTHSLSDSKYSLAPNNDGMNTSRSPIDRQWMYHAVSQTIIANNILRKSELVDKDKIGLTGISWGGVIAATAIGHDNRFAFAIPVYGSGYLYESLAWMNTNFNYPGTKEIWDPSHNLKNAKMPVLWLCWTNDNCFSINSNDKSFADTEKGILSMKMNMQHGHIEGWVAPEIYRFADSVVKGKEPLTTCKTQPGTTKDISFTINRPSDASKITAKVYYIKEKMTYSRNGRLNLDWCDTIDQEWFSVNCTVNNNNISAKLPNDAYSYYVEITTQVGSAKYVTTSRFITLNNRKESEFS